MRLRLFISCVAMILAQCGMAQSAESDRLYAEGVDLYNAARYREAIGRFERVDSIDRAEMDSLNERRMFGRTWLASCWYMLGDTAKAQSYDADAYHLPPIDRRLTVESDSLTFAALQLCMQGDAAAAEQIMHRVLELDESRFGKEHYWLYGTLYALAVTRVVQGDADGGIQYALKAYELAAKHSPGGENIYKICLDLCTFNMQAGRFLECRQWLDRGEQLIVRKYGKVSKQYEPVFMSRFQLSLVERKWKEAEALVEEKIRIDEALYGNGSWQMYNCLSWVAQLYGQAGRTKEAQRYSSEAQKRMEASGNKEDAESGHYMAEMNVIRDLFAKGDYRQVEKRCSAAIKELENKTDTTLRIAYWAFTSLRVNCQMMRYKRYLTPITYEQYKQARREVGDGSTLVGYMYVLGQLIRPDGTPIANDTTLAVLREITPFYLASSSGNTLSIASSRSELAMAYAMHNQLSEARRLSAESAAAYTSLINTPSVSYAYDKIAKSMEQHTTVYDALIRKENSRYFASMGFKGSMEHDSISYALHKIRANITECQLRLRLKQGVKSDFDMVQDVRSYIYDMLNSCKDGLHCRSFVKEFLQQVEAERGESCYMYTLLEKQYLKLLPKGSPEGREYYERELAKYKGLEEWQWRYDSLLEEYYEYIGDRQALANLKISRMTGNDQHTLLAKYSLFHEEGMHEAAFEAMRQYLELYPRKSLDFYALGNYLKNTLEVAPDTAYSTFARLLDKAEASKRNKDVASVVGLLCSGYYQIPQCRKDSLLQFTRRQVETRRVFARDNKLRLYMDILQLEFCYFSKDEATMASLLDDARQYVVDADDRGLLLYAEAVLKAECDFDSRADIYRRAITQFEADGFLIQTNEYKQLLSMLYVFLDAHRDAAEVLDVYNKLNRPDGVKLSERLKEQVASKGSQLDLPYYLYYNASLVGLDIEKLAQAQEKLGLSALLKPTLVSKFRTNIQDVRDGLKTGYRDWDDLASRAASVVAENSQYACRFPESDSLAIMAYDAAMLCKGMLLRAEGGLYSMLSRSDNASISARFAELQAIRASLDSVRSAGGNTYVLQQRYSDARNKLIGEANVLGDFAHSLLSTSSHVAARLRRGEAAVEFTSFAQDSQTVYCALILRSGQNVPSVVRLCTESDLQAVSSPYATADVYRLVWQPLATALDGVSDVYFAPTGIFHQLAIEYVPAADGRQISDLYNLYRLSNTAELLQARNKKAPMKNVALYGGILYEDDDDVVAVADYEKRSRFGIEYLPGTKEEIEGIGAELSAGKIASVMTTGHEATEASVKALSSTETSVLHLATHGFYDPSLQTDKDDDPLVCSGLYMAGAAGTVYGETHKAEDEDGILTAKDIADMDLAATDLVVLSACQTALGYVSGEGVFGLQRGFKKAGVKSILMSLWPVDDEATQILMTRFYHNFVKSGNKREALKEAQQYLRTVEDGYYDNPEYWAAFILLDALDNR